MKHEFLLDKYSIESDGTLAIRVPFDTSKCEFRTIHAHKRSSKCTIIRQMVKNNSGFDEHSYIGVCSNFLPKRKHSITQSSFIICSIIIVEVHNDKHIWSLCSFSAAAAMMSLECILYRHQK